MGSHCQSCTCYQLGQYMQYTSGASQQLYVQQYMSGWHINEPTPVKKGLLEKMKELKDA